MKLYDGNLARRNYTTELFTSEPLPLQLRNHEETGDFLIEKKMRRERDTLSLSLFERHSILFAPTLQPMAFEYFKRTYDTEIDDPRG